MYTRALFDIIHAQGHAALDLLLALEEGPDELFASPATLAALESALGTVTATLAHLPPVVLLRLPQVDWSGWAALQQALRDPPGPARRDVLWYGACALLPATLVLLERLRAREPDWFEIQY